MDKTITLPEISEILKLTPQATGKIVRGLDSELIGNTRHLRPMNVRVLFEQRGFQYPTKNIVFHCLKGGASKTTLAYNTAYRLSQLGSRVLLVDLDKQANATLSFGVTRPLKVFVDVITEKVAISETIVPVGDFLNLLPSSLENARLEMELINRKKNPKNFYHNVFAPIRSDYDVIILDLPPDLNHNTYLSSLFASTICIPTNPDEYSVYGMKMTLGSIEGIQKEYENLRQDVFIVWSRYDARERNSFHYLTEIKDFGLAKVMPVVIRSDSTFKNAQSNNKSVFELKKRSNAKDDIDILAQELIGIREFFGPKGNA
jgi:chromosome partitioning protein